MPGREHAVTTYRKKLTFWHTVRIVLRNSAVAAAVRILYGIVKLLLRRGLSKAFLRDLPEEFLSLNPLKWAAVLAGFSSFRFCKQTLSHLMPEKPASLVSGAVCSLPVLVMNKPTRTDLCLYAFVRAVHAFVLRFILPRCPKPIRNFQHYDTLTMCLSSAQIGYSAVLSQYSMPSSYLNFLLRAAQYDPNLMRSGAAYLRHYECTPDLMRFCDRAGFQPSYTYEDASYRLCLYSNHTNCNVAAVTSLIRRFFTLGLPLYGPLKVATMLGMQRHKLARQPRQTLLRAVKSVVSSSLFLAAYVTVVQRASCFCIAHGKSDVALSSLCFCAGLTTLLEPKSRRADLAFYCAMYGVRGFIMSQNRLGRLPYPRHRFVLLTYIASMAFLFYEYDEEPDLVNARVRWLFSSALGEKVPSARKGGDSSSSAAGSGSLRGDSAEAAAGAASSAASVGSHSSSRRHRHHHRRTQEGQEA